MKISLTHELMEILGLHYGHHSQEWIWYADKFDIMFDIRLRGWEIANFIEYEYLPKYSEFLNKLIG